MAELLEHDSLSLPLRREHALAQLGPLVTPRQAHPYRRVFVTFGAQACDCYGGVVLRAAIDAHLAGHSESRAELWEPKDPAVWSRLHDFLSPLPERCELVKDQPLPHRNREIVVPAIAVSEPELAELLGLTIVRASSALGLEISSARAIAQALAVLTENARVHAPDSAVGALAACALEPEAQELQVAVLDLGSAAAERDDPHVWLVEALGRSRERLGNLASLMALADRRGVEAILRIASGPARARWRAGDRIRYDQGAIVPGTVASFGVRLH